jgi:hypothetical protein
MRMAKTVEHDGQRLVAVEHEQEQPDDDGANQFAHETEECHARQ